MLPGAPPWPPGRGGRSSRRSPPGRGAPPGRCIPVEPPDVNGLLPGRGPAGRAAPGRAPPWPGPAGRAPGRAPPSRCWPEPEPCAGAGRAGRGPGVAPPERGAAGACGADGGAWNSAAGTGAAGAGLGAGAAGAGFGPGRGPAPGAGVLEPPEPAPGAAGAGGGATGLTGPPAGLGAGAAGRAGAPGVGAPGLAATLLRGAAGFAAGLPALPPPGPWKASVNLRTTGASMVEDAERTNSPSSWSLAMTTLLSTPISLASSYTRTLATSLLLGPG